MKRFLELTTVAAAAAAVALPVWAGAAPQDELVGLTNQQTAAAPTAEAPEADAPVKVIAELGTALAKGNTDTFHINTDTRVIVAPGANWILETRGRAHYEESSGVTTANNWSLSERADRFVSERISLFGAAQIERNTFAGIGRRLSGQLGAAFIAWETREPTKEDLITNRLRLEAGGYGAHESFVVSPNDPGATLPEDERTIWAARLALSYLHAITRSTNAGADIEYIQDFVDVDNVVVNSSVYVAAAIVDGFALKITGSHRFDNVPASSDPPLEKSDFLLTAGVVVTF